MYEYLIIFFFFFCAVLLVLYELSPSVQLTSLQNVRDFVCDKYYRFDIVEKTHTKKQETPTSSMGGPSFDGECLFHGMRWKRGVVVQD